MRQKRVAVINDLSCYGRCSLTVQLPILNLMNFETCPLPTALYSAHGAFPGHSSVALGRNLEEILQHWKLLNLHFDGVLCGFLPDSGYLSAVLDFVSEQKQNGASIILDPVLGDHGKFYSIADSRTCENYRALLPAADLVVPNLTECCALLGIPYPSVPPDTEQLFEYAGQLSASGAKAVVITGVPVLPDYTSSVEKGSGIPADFSAHELLLNILWESNDKKEKISVKKIGSDRSGTGDLFSALLAGYLWNDMPLSQAACQATDFLSHALTYTAKQQLPPKNGVCFEAFLSELPLNWK